MKQNTPEPALRLKLSILLTCLFLLTAASPLPRPVSAPQDAPRADIAPGEIVVGLKDGYTFQSIDLPSKVSFIDVSPELATLQVGVVRVPAGQEQQYRSILTTTEGVLFAEPNYRVQALDYDPNDPAWTEQWAPRVIQAAQAWDNGYRGSPGVTIAVIDSGIDASHPDFAGRLLTGYDFIQRDTSPQDECGHGTHVAGILAASGDNSVHIAGVDWNAKILPLRVLGNVNGACIGDDVDVAKALVWAVDHDGADVINLSLGNLFGSSRLLEYATYYAYQRGAAVIAAAGQNNGQVSYPAAFPWVLAVGATDRFNTRYSMSNYGAALDVMAPGLDILSTFPTQPVALYPGFTDTHTLSGTSMAAAHASGAAAILASQPQFDHPEKIYAALRGTALDLGAAGRDDFYGSGLIQIYDALSFDTSTVQPPAPPAASVEYDVLSSDRCQNVTYAWQDIPLTGYIPIFDNNSGVEINLPFTFRYGGVDYTTATVYDNGFMDFVGGQQAEAQNFIIPTADWGGTFTRPNHLLAPFWDDLNTGFTAEDPSTGVYRATLGNAPNRRFVIQWHHVHLQSNYDATSLTFQVVLYEGSNRILYQYADLTGPGSDGSSATVGLEYNQGYSGVLHAYNRPGALREGLALRFEPAAPGSARNPEGCLSAGQAGTGRTTLTQGNWCLDILPGTLSQTHTVRFSVFQNFTPSFARYLSIGQFAEISLDPMPEPPLRPSPQVCYYVTPQDLARAGGHAENLFMAVYDHELEVWERLPTAVDVTNLYLQAPIPHFSVFGVFATAVDSGSPVPEELPVTGAGWIARRWEMPAPQVGINNAWTAILGWLVLIQGMIWFKRK